jgi:hypothetical protein
MLRFQTFPIYVLYSLHRQRDISSLWNQYFQEKKNAQENAVRQLVKLNFGEMVRFLQIAQEKNSLIGAAMQWELVEDLDPKYRNEIREYEKTVERLLTIISHTSVGNYLLSMIKPDAKVFVIPADWSQPTAVTWDRAEDEGGGIRIYFNPSAFRRIFVSPRRAPADEAEDTLFHELVHAMRKSNDRYGGKILMNRDFGNTEEFIATQIANIFHAARRRSDIYDSYHGEFRRKNEMYKYLIEDAELVMALKFFMQTEPLAKAAAFLHQPEYNPFRDFKQIERKSLKHYGVDEFMNL